MRVNLIGVPPVIYLSGIHSSQVDQAWPDVTDFLQMALDKGHGEHTLETLYEGVTDGTLQLWVGHENYTPVYAGITRIGNQPSGDKTAEVLYLGGGRVDEWLDHIRTIEAWARHNGCNELRIYGRRGWSKKMVNYTDRYTIIGKAL